MELVEALRNRDATKINENLNIFLRENGEKLLLESLVNQSTIWSLLQDVLKDPSLCDCYLYSLQGMKILSRNKQLLKTPNESVIETLFDHAALVPLNMDVFSSSKTENIIEALKCIFNLLFQDSRYRNAFSTSFIIERIILRSSYYEQHQISSPIQLFDMKILFLLTALSLESRSHFRYTLGGITRLTAMLNKILASCNELTEEQVDFCSEILKILFNLLLASERPKVDHIPDFEFKSLNIHDDDESMFHNLLNVVKHLMLNNVNNNIKRLELTSHLINLLTSINSEYYEVLLEPCVSPVTAENLQNPDNSMIVIVCLLQFLQNGVDQPIEVLKEKIAPTLSVLIEFCRRYNKVRRFVRMYVLPPLRDATQRPEQGDSIRSKLCRLMTSAVNDVAVMVAEFLFVLCKENVGRLIKYTGYGNAAGLLANRGLMLGRRTNSYEGHYSSDSEDSDTDEYAKIQDRINPVTGCFEPPRTSLVEDMTEEQKEYEAVRLINLMDKLQREGIIQPARIGEDGKPKPVEHVLELQEQLKHPLG